MAGPLLDMIPIFLIDSQLFSFYVFIEKLHLRSYVVMAYLPRQVHKAEYPITDDTLTSYQIITHGRKHGFPNCRKDMPGEKIYGF